MTRKLIGRPCVLVSVGAMTPSIEQYAGALPVAATHRGAASVTPATGSPIDATGIAVPSLVLEQSSVEIVRDAGCTGVWTATAWRPISGISNAASAAPAMRTDLTGWFMPDLIP